MSLPPAEERKFQRTKVDQLDYIALLLEWIAYKVSPGNLDFEPFQAFLRSKHASRFQSPAEVLRDLPARPATRSRQVSGHESVQNAGVLGDSYEDFTLSQVS